MTSGPDLPENHRVNGLEKPLGGWIRFLEFISNLQKIEIKANYTGDYTSDVIRRIDAIRPIIIVLLVISIIYFIAKNYRFTGTYNWFFYVWMLLQEAEIAQLNLKILFRGIVAEFTFWKFENGLMYYLIYFYILIQFPETQYKCL